MQVEDQSMEYHRSIKPAERLLVAEVIKWMSKLQHPNILRLLQASYDGTRLKASFEPADSSLLYYIQHRGSLDMDLVVSIAHQLLVGVEYIHRCGVLHASLTTENIMLCGGVVRIAHLIDALPQSNSTLNYVCSRNYRPPEIIIGLQPSDPSKVDLWSVGCILFELVTGTPLFSLLSSKENGITQTKRLKEQLEDVVKAVGVPTDEDCEGFSAKQIEFVTTLSVASPGIVQLIQQYIPDKELGLQYASVVQACLAFSPSKRPSASAVLTALIFDKQQSVPDVKSVQIESIPLEPGIDPLTTVVSCLDK